jgi:hypothetical protein
MSVALSRRLPDDLDELMEDPTKYGMPTFEEFRRNKEKYLGRPDDEVASVDRGDPVLGLRHRYYLDTLAGEYRIDSLEQADRICREMGKNLFTDFYVDPQIRDDGPQGRSLITHVYFRAKDKVEKRRSWG